MARFFAMATASSLLTCTILKGRYTWFGSVHAVFIIPVPSLRLQTSSVPPHLHHLIQQAHIEDARHEASTNALDLVGP